MFKKILSFLICISIVLCCFSGCKKDDKSGKSFSFAVSSMPRFFDPQATETSAEKMIAVNTFDGLFKVSEDGKLEKCCVENYTVSDDGLIYTFNLRKDLKYYVSQSVKKFLEEENATIDDRITAKDFVFGIKRGLSKETDSKDFEILSAIKNSEAFHRGEIDHSEVPVVAVDDYTLKIELSRRDDNFIYALSQPISYPCNRSFFELTKGRYGLEKRYILSNGAFYVSNINDDKSVKISKNEEYNGNFKAEPLNVNFFVNSSDVEVAKKLKKDGYDCGFFVSDASIKELKKSSKKTEIYNITKSLIFNGNNEKLQNTKLRVGLCSAIQMDTVVNIPQNNLVPIAYKLNGNAENILYNPDFAKQNLIESFKEMEVSTLQIEILCTEDDENMAKLMVQCWQKNIGVELNGIVKAVPEDDFKKLINKGNYEAAIYPLTVDSPDALGFLEMFRSDSQNNILNYKSEEYDKLYNELKENYSNEKAIYCESFLQKNGVVLPICSKKTVFATKSDVEGIYIGTDSANVYFYKGQK